MNPRSLGITKNITFKYNSFVNEELDKRKSHNDSKGEIIDNNLIKNNSNSDTESESTADSNKPSYIEKYENCTKILTNLEAQCI